MASELATIDDNQGLALQPLEPYLEAVQLPTVNPEVAIRRPLVTITQ